MPKNFTTKVVAEALNGRLIGDGTITVTRVAHPADIRSPEDLVLATDTKLWPLLAGGAAKVAVVGKTDTKPEGVAACIVVDRPRLAMAKLTQLFAEPVAVPPGIHPSAFIEKGAKLGANVTVGAFSYVASGAVIGNNSVIHPQVYIGPEAALGRDALVYSGVRIGARVRIGSGFIAHFNATIGADGFSFVTPQTGSVEQAKQGGGDNVSVTNNELVRIASLGSVIIGDDVEIGANTSIDRGTIVATTIGNGTKIDNQVQIGHNVVIGDNCLICGRVGIAGSATIGNRVVLGGATGVADHVKIGDDAICMAMSGVAGNVPPRTVVGGSPALPREKAVENHMNIGRLKNLISKVKDLAEHIDRLDPPKS